MKLLFKLVVIVFISSCSVSDGYVDTKTAGHLPKEVALDYLNEITYSCEFKRDGIYTNGLVIPFSAVDVRYFPRWGDENEEKLSEFQVIHPKGANLRWTIENQCSFYRPDTDEKLVTALASLNMKIRK